MKKTLYFVPLIFLTLQSFAQISDDIAAYYPDGKRINFKLGQVYFKKLSNKPIFILFIDKKSPMKIKEILNSYDYSKYLNSYTYYWDLKDMIKRGVLTKDYLQDIFKDPDSKGKEDDGLEYWIYKNYNVKIIFDGNMSKSADVINYKAFQRNEMAVPIFEVTGSDYTIGCNISLTNFGKKIIKYVFITVTATNPVDDKVGTKTVKAVGPIKPSETGTYEFSDIIYSRTARYLTIDNIKIQYMDSSIKIISKNEAQSIKITDWEEIGKRVAD
jgi:hypothetical protein